MRLLLFVIPSLFAMAGNSQDTLNHAAIADTSKNSDFDDRDITFTKVEFEAEYPGGIPGWQKYLIKNLHYPVEAISNEIQGEVIIQFIVDKEGNVSDVQAVSGPTKGGLREESIRVIKLSGNWIPATQNGRKVRSYKKQPFRFKLSTR